MTCSRVLIYVQHLLGIGHLRRAAVLARACVGHGLDVTLVSGGTAVDDIDLAGAAFVQLAPLRSRDETFSELVDTTGRPVDAAWLARRRARLLDLFAQVRPHVLVVEMFPFGRRKLKSEILALLDAAHGVNPRPRIVSSVRDVLIARKRARDAEAADWARRYFDAILVHGDPEVIRFEESFSAAADIADRIFYTGYIAAREGRRGRRGSPGWNEVIVSAGGGAFGEMLLRTANEARPYSRSTSDLHWRLLAAASLSNESFTALSATAPAGLSVERARPDFPDLLKNCAVSVSQGGYNTTVDVLQARARAIIVPFARGGETEQSQRAARLEALGLLRCIAERDLTPARLVAAIDAAVTGPRPRPAKIDIGGATRSAALIGRWARQGNE